MVVSSVCKYRRAIELNSDNLNELDVILKKYYSNVKYKASLFDESNLKFDNLAELLDYKNEQDRKISSLKVTAGDYDFSNDIEILFEAGYHFIKAFSYSVKYEYRFEDREREILFKSEIESYLRQRKQDPILSVASKISTVMFCFFTSILCFCYSIYVRYFRISEKNVSASQETTVPFETIILVVMILGVGIFIFDRGWKYMFPPILFLIGEEKKNNKFREKIRTIVFSGIVLALIISITASYIFSLAN